MAIIWLYYLQLSIAVAVVLAFALHATADYDDQFRRRGAMPTQRRYEYVTTGHRLFPAAQLETYTPTSPMIGIVSVRNLTLTATTTTPSGQTQAMDEILQPAIARFKRSLTRLPDFALDYAVNPSNRHMHIIDHIDIVVQSTDTTLRHGVKEDYELSLPDDLPFGVLRASTVFGVLRGLESLGQLLEYGWKSPPRGGDGVGGGDTIFVIRDIPLFVSDSPSYPYRGLMIDTARHYLPLTLILDNLDVMAMNKLNVLHWHISDTQSFPFATQHYPELAKKGAFHPKRIYTVDDVKTVIHAAYLRGIRVIPEVDMPGHTNAIAKSHPEIMSHCPNPTEPINPTVPETYQFVTTLYTDLADLFFDEFVHVGGDEVEFGEKCWLNSTSIVQWMKEHKMNRTVELYEYFETRLLKIVANLDKTPIVWQEVFNLNLTIPNNTIIDVWKGFDRATIQNATLRNYRTILSGCWYLDHLGDTWETYYRCDPRNFTGGNKDLMIGGHASMWGENVDASNFISRVWPRASAAAERLWTGDVSDGPSDTISDRIHNFRCRMVQQGYAVGPTRPGSCPTEVRYEPSSDSKVFNFKAERIEVDGVREATSLFEPFGSDQ